MTMLEKSSKRKANAIRYCVDKGEYSAGYGLDKLETLHDAGKILDVDYEPLAEYLEELMEEPVEEIAEQELSNVESEGEVE